MMRFGSLFSGIGGIDLGLERAGMECAWQIEIDPFCQAVLSKHWPHVPKYGDIREVTGHELAPVDLVCAGFPCQPVSLAGKRLAQDDPRWLWPELARLIRVVRPRYVLLENVPGLLSRGMGDVLGDLAALGYDAEWDCLPAAAFGAPHIRDRVFIVAYPDAYSRRRQELQERYGRPEAHPADRDSSWADADGLCNAVADANVPRLALGQVFGGDAKAELAAFVRDCGAHWETEPDVGRVAHGIPSRVDRLRGLGNAVVPQVAEWIGRRIVEVDKP